MAMMTGCDDVPTGWGCAAGVSNADITARHVWPYRRGFAPVRSGHVACSNPSGIMLARSVVLLAAMPMVLACSGGDSPSEEGPGPDCATVDDHIECTYKEVDGLALQADIYGVDAQGDAARPAILWIHGGALIFGHRIELAYADEQLELYLERGHVVVSIDYRLAPATALDRIQEDVADAYTWLREVGPAIFGIDRDRIGVVGHSAGAYLALSLGFRVAPRPAALVSFYGYGGLGWYGQPSPIYLEDELIDGDDPAVVAVRNGPPIANSSLEELDQRIAFYIYCRQTGRWQIEVGGRDPAVEPSYFADQEPLRHVGPDYPATMLLHGQMDEDVPFSEAMAMAAALEAEGVDVAFVHDGLPRYEGAIFEHGFDEDMDAPGVRMAFGEALEFLERHLLGDG